MYHHLATLLTLFILLSWHGGCRCCAALLILQCCWKVSAVRQAYRERRELVVHRGTVAVDIDKREIGYAEDVTLGLGEGLRFSEERDIGEGPARLGSYLPNLLT